MHRRSAVVALVLAPALLLAACSSGDDSASSAAATPKVHATTTTTGATRNTTALPASYRGYHSATYAKPESWLCRGDVPNDICDTDMDATILQADGSTTIERFTPAADASVDCFYVYPTVSNDPTRFSDMTPGVGEEEFVVRQQAARLGSECRVFAPIYRQLTRGGLAARLTGQPAPPGDANIQPYDDVLDAWKQYMANDNGGRGVVLVGHSQGSGILLRLLAREIDPDPNLRGRLVSAIIPGAAVRVPPGGDVGGALQHIPVCRADDQVGCVIAYSTFRATAPPPPNAHFGRVRNGQAACANPAALGGGSAPVHPYFGTSPRGQPTSVGANRWAKGVTITTPFVALPGLVTGQCVVRDNASYLELTIHGDPSTPRVDDIPGDLTPPWGMHLVDVNVEMGDIATLVGHQIAAYTKK